MPEPNNPQPRRRWELDLKHLVNSIERFKDPWIWLIPVLIVLLTCLYLPGINTFITSYLLFDSSLISKSPSVYKLFHASLLFLLFIACWIACLYGIRRIFLKRSFLLLYLYFSTSWFGYFQFAIHWEPITWFSFDYLSILYIIPPIFYFLAFVASSIQRPSNGGEICFFEDNELELIEKADNHLRHQSAAELKRRILKQDFSKSFSIALVGPWGSGKTSFANTILHELKAEKDVIIVKLHTQNYDDDQFLAGFLSEISKYLNPFDPNLNRKFEKYINVISEISHKGFYSIFKSLVTTTESQEELREKIEKSILRLGKKIILLIDDMDRLTTEETLTVLKLIRNTANFPNFCYLICFDKKYLQKIFNRNTYPSEPDYVEKYFQFEFYLPRIEESTVRQFFVDLISHLELPNFDKIVFSNSVFNDYITNFRDCKRLANIFVFDYTIIHCEVKDEPIVDLTDLLEVSILKLKFGDVYHELAINSRRYFRFLNPEIKHVQVDESSTSSETINFSQGSQLYQFSEGRFKDSVPILNSLFNGKRKYFQPAISINRSAHFHKYFYLNELSGSAPYDQFIALFRDFDNQREELLKYIKKYPDDAANYLGSTNDENGNWISGLLMFTELTIPLKHFQNALQALTRWIDSESFSEPLLMQKLNSEGNERIIYVYHSLFSRFIATPEESENVVISLNGFLNSLNFDRLEEFEETLIELFEIYYLKGLSSQIKNIVRNKMGSIIQEKSAGYANLLKMLISEGKKGNFTLNNHYNKLSEDFTLFSSEPKNPNEKEFKNFVDILVLSGFEPGHIAGQIPFNFDFLDIKPLKTQSKLLVFQYNSLDGIKLKEAVLQSLNGIHLQCHFNSKEDIFLVLSNNKNYSLEEEFKAVRNRIEDILIQKFGKSVARVSITLRDAKLGNSKVVLKENDNPLILLVQAEPISHN